MKSRRMQEYLFAARYAVVVMVVFIGLGPAGLARAEAGIELTDRNIANAVLDRLEDDPVVPAVHIDAVSSDGTVTLSGRVDNLLDKERAERIASTVKGVRGVVNGIEVAAPKRPDGEIRQAVEKGLARDAVTKLRQIDVSVDGQAVTLRGSVDSRQEYRLAGRVAKGVKGVKELDNEIEVVTEQGRSDEEISEDITSTLRWDAFVDDGMIEVAVDAGKVILTGAVGSLAEKKLAGSDAWVAGVTGVDNRLDVQWRDRSRLRRDKYVSRTDSEIEAAVKHVLASDPRVAAARLTIGSRRGRVTLRGQVTNLKARHAAARDAGSVVGVWSVDNRIKVRAGERDDKAVAAEIRDALQQDPYVDRDTIKVAVDNGVAYLLGIVDSVYQKNRAADIASTEQGVTGVRNDLTVYGPLLDIDNPYVDELRSYRQGGGHSGSSASIGATAMKSDYEIKEGIRDQLFWSPFVDGGDIDIRVDNGEVTLSGTVDTWNERRAATENALQGGAVIVHNRLKVRFGPEEYQP